MLPKHERYQTALRPEKMLAFIKSPGHDSQKAKFGGLNELNMRANSLIIPTAVGTAADRDYGWLVSGLRPRGYQTAMFRLTRTLCVVITRAPAISFQPVLCFAVVLPRPSPAGSHVVMWPVTPKVHAFLAKIQHVLVAIVRLAVSVFDWRHVFLPLI